MRIEGTASVRTKLPFRSVNRPGHAGYRAGLQRHHLLPCAAARHRCFGRMFAALGYNQLGFDDFRRNGMLLPATEPTAELIGLPLHRGPHRTYTELVFERLGAIERCWIQAHRRSPVSAQVDALYRIGLLQDALRKRLLVQRRPLRLNTAERRVAPPDFAVLDAMASQLWSATAATQSESG